MFKKRPLLLFVPSSPSCVSPGGRDNAATCVYSRSTYPQVTSDNARSFSLFRGCFSFLAPMLRWPPQIGRRMGGARRRLVGLAVSSLVEAHVRPQASVAAVDVFGGRHTSPLPSCSLTKQCWNAPVRYRSSDGPPAPFVAHADKTLVDSNERTPPPLT